MDLTPLISIRSGFIACLLGVPMAGSLAQPGNPNPFTKPASSSMVEPAATFLGFYLENDVIFHSTDQNYTGGMALVSGGRWVSESGLAGPLNLFDWLTGMKRLHRAREVHRHSFGLLASGFTPNRADLGKAAPVFDDRPYASIFGSRVTRVSTGPADAVEKFRWSVTSELTAAVLGLNLVKHVQTGIHRELRRWFKDSLPVDPMGWANQISHGGEFSFLYRVGAERVMLGATEVKPGWQSQLTFTSEAMVGYYDNVAAGFSGRVGRLTTQQWEFSSNPMGSVQQKRTGEDTEYELFLLAGLRTRLVAYNALLQGGFRDGVHEFKSGQVERALIEGEFGARATVGSWGVTIIPIAGRTAEFKGAKARPHVWGAVHVTYSPSSP